MMKGVLSFGLAGLAIIKPIFADGLPDIYSNAVANWITAALAFIVVVLLKYGISGVLKQLSNLNHKIENLNDRIIEIEKDHIHLLSVLNVPARRGKSHRREEDE